jgi:beta-phosphoglucomutase-like phosphatase (HAD superfamily)
VAVEDNAGGVQAAVDPGVPCIAFPNENTGGLDFAGAAERVSRLDFATVAPLVRGAREAR